MKAEIQITFTRDEINASLPYQIVAETMGGASWDTRKRRKLQSEMFTESEIGQLENLYKLAKKWYLIKGVPDEVIMMYDTAILFKKLGNFCAMI